MLKILEVRRYRGSHLMITAHALSLARDYRLMEAYPDIRRGFLEGDLTGYNSSD